MYAPLWCKSNFSFLEGASHAEELVEEAHRLGIGSIALTDRDGVHGMVRAHVKARELGVHLICGAQLTVAAPAARLTSSPVSLVDLHDDHRGRGPGWSHDTEGPDDMPAHIRSALTQTSLSIPVIAGRLALGTWQGIYLFEHRSAPQQRSVVLYLSR